MTQDTHFIDMDSIDIAETITYEAMDELITLLEHRNDTVPQREGVTHCAYGMNMAIGRGDCEMLVRMLKLGCAVGEDSGETSAEPLLVQAAKSSGLSLQMVWLLLINGANPWATWKEDQKAKQGKTASMYMEELRSNPTDISKLSCLTDCITLLINAQSHFSGTGNGYCDWLMFQALDTHHEGDTSSTSACTLSLTSIVAGI